VWPDFPASDFKLICNPPTADKIGFELGLFFGLLNNRFFCNPLLKLSLHSFGLFLNWLCLALNWVCFSDFTKCPISHIYLL